jgi:DNA-binding SARP family transcriptional activator
MHRLAINLLGAPEVLLDGASVRFDTRKAMALLAYLACTGRAHTRDALATLLWPEYADARNALRRTLSTLHNTLGAGWLTIERDHVALVPQPALALDVAHFLAGTESTADADQLAASLERYQGDFLAGFTLRDSLAFDEWQLYEAERLQQRCVLGLDRLTALHAAAGAYTAAITTARRRLALDPLHEPAYQSLMRLYAATGQRTAALRQYQLCAQRLHAAFGVEPSVETMELYASIQTTTPPPQVSTAALVPHSNASAMPALVGRDAEQQRLHMLYQQAEQGALAVISGQPGIGKTRLAEDLLAEAQRAGALTVMVRCYQGEHSLAYAPFTALLRAALGLLERTDRLKTVPSRQLAAITRLVPDLALHRDAAHEVALTEPEARRRFFEAVSDLLFTSCASALPGIIWLDDVHWADSASLDLLAFLAHRLPNHGLLLLLTWRDEEVPFQHPLHTLLSDMRRLRPVMQIALGPLDLQAVAQLAHMRGVPLPDALVPRLHAESGGLPLFVVEFLAVLREGGLPLDGSPWALPRRARDLLEVRLRSLSDTAQTLLSGAAVLGHAFDLPMLCAALQLSEDAVVDALEETLRRGLLVETTAMPLHYTFSHERVRTLVYEQISSIRRRVLHRRVAHYFAALRADGGAVGYAAQAADHAQAAGETALAAHQYRLAGDAARLLAAHSEAVNHYLAAITLGHPEQAVLHTALGDLRTLAGEYAAALHHYAAAQASGADNARKIGEIHYRLGDWAAAEAHFAAVLAHPTNHPSERALTAAAWSLVERRRGHLEQATRLAADAVTLAEQAQESRALARAYGVTGTLVAHQQDLPQALILLEQGLRHAQQVDDAETRVAALNSLALVLATVDPLRAITVAESALALCVACDDRHRAAALHNTLADLHHIIGEPGTAQAHLRTAVTLFAAIGHDQPAIWMLTEW